MARAQDYKREQDGLRFALKGMNTILPPDAQPQGKFPYLQNVRSYRGNQARGRATQSTPLFALPAPVHTLRRMNDLTPAGPVGGFTIIGGAGGGLFNNATQVDSGYSGNPLSFVPFRPNQSVQPWMYVADSLKMSKVRSDGLTYKDGVAEPQAAPVVGTENTTVSGSVFVPGTTMPWLTAGGQNPSYNYGAGGGTGPVSITAAAGTTITLTASGTVNTSYGVGQAPGNAGPVTSNSPGFFVPGGSCRVLCGAFTDASGNVITPTVGSGPVSIGASASFLVPVGATKLQIGIDDTTYGSNSGTFTVNYTVTTSAITTVPALIGDVTVYYWGDSPHSGPVAQYIWKNVSDSGGSGPVRSISDAAGTTTGNSLIFDSTPSAGSSPVAWSVFDSTGTITGTKSLFQPALESQGYQDFNATVQATLFIPAAGTYSVNITYKDNILWGIGNNANWPSRGSVVGTSGQSVTVLDRLPLLPAPTISGNGGVIGSSTVAVTFPGAGSYPIELNWDYWFHSGRTLVVTINGLNPAPLSNTVKTNVQYRYIYRSSVTGALSNPSPASAQQQVPVQANTVTPAFSTDPQVDKVDYYRIDSSVDDYTYVGTGPNTNPPTPFTDATLDSDISGNPILQLDNFEPFPSIDLPKKGVINVTSGIATWVSGDQFNIRWLPGTIINSGGINYVFDRRPTSATALTAVGITDGINLPYEIRQPKLAAQPMPSMWGPTDEAAYMFACGDPLRPGTLYFTKGNNPDSAPDTNQIEITSPSEPLMNGIILDGNGMVFSTERAWDLYPNFTSATATVTGVLGSAFRPIEAISDRGLYIRNAICTDGGKRGFFRAKDGISACVASGGTQSISDGDIWNLFPHEGFKPTAITLSGFTVFPPDDTRPEKQSLRFGNGYLYYDYQDINGNPRTLVYDVVMGGWSVDVYQFVVTTHEVEEGPNINGTYTGCNDGSVRVLTNNGVEVATSVILTASFNGGDARANKMLGDVFVRAQVDTAAPVNFSVLARESRDVIAGITPANMTGNGSLQDFILDFADGGPRDIRDVSMLFQWPTVNSTYLDLWQPDWVPQPEVTQDRPTDWDDAGSQGNMFIQGMLLECNTFGRAKSFALQSSDDNSLHFPDQNPITTNGQTKVALTFTPPFVAHSYRIVSTDGVPWRVFSSSLKYSAYPESTTEWQTEFTSHGMDGWLSILPVINIAHNSTADLTLTLVFDHWPTIVLNVPNSGGVQRKDKIVVPYNNFKLVSYRLNSSAPFALFASQCEVKIGQWGRNSLARVVTPFGGPDETKAEV